MFSLCLSVHCGGAATPANWSLVSGPMPFPRAGDGKGRERRGYTCSLVFGPRSKGRAKERGLKSHISLFHSNCRVPKSGPSTGVPAPIPPPFKTRTGH